jgi:hypothetical protein
MYSVYAVVAQLHVTADYIKILSITQQCFYGTSVTRNNANCMYQFLKIVTSNVYSFHVLHINVALKQKNVHLLMALH